MKKINGLYKPSATEIKRAKAHCRALCRAYPLYSGASVEVFFDAGAGAFLYFEHIGNGYTVFDDPDVYHVYTAYRQYF